MLRHDSMVVDREGNALLGPVVWCWVVLSWMLLLLLNY